MESLLTNMCEVASPLGNLISDATRFSDPGCLDSFTDRLVVANHITHKKYPFFRQYTLQYWISQLVENSERLNKPK